MKNVKFPANVAEEMLWDKICVGIIGTYIISIKVKKESLNLKFDTMINPVTDWFEITQYNDKHVITIT